MEVCLCLGIELTLSLGVCSQILKQTCNTTDRLIKVMSFLERAVQRFEDFLAVLALLALIFCDCLDVVFEIATHMFPC